MKLPSSSRGYILTLGDGSHERKLDEPMPCSGTPLIHGHGTLLPVRPTESSRVLAFRYTEYENCEGGRGSVQHVDGFIENRYNEQGDETKTSGLLNDRVLDFYKSCCCLDMSNLILRFFKLPMRLLLRLSYFTAPQSQTRPNSNPADILCLLHAY